MLAICLISIFLLGLILGAAFSFSDFKDRLSLNQTPFLDSKGTLQWHDEIKNEGE